MAKAAVAQHGVPINLACTVSHQQDLLSLSSQTAGRKRHHCALAGAPERQYRTGALNFITWSLAKLGTSSKTIFKSTGFIGSWN